MYLTIISDTKGTILSCPIDKDINIQDNDWIAIGECKYCVRRKEYSIESITYTGCRQAIVKCITLHVFLIMTIEFVIQQIENVKIELARKQVAVINIISEYISDENTVKNTTDIIDSLNDVTVNIRRSIKALQTLKDVLK